jgi:hypothetical protein
MSPPKDDCAIFCGKAVTFSLRTNGSFSGYKWLFLSGPIRLISGKIKLLRVWKMLTGR